MSLFTTSLFRWLQRKRYQYEVTFSLYMLSPTEKFIFNSIIFIIFSMISIAAILYLPEHVAIIARRASFYWAGEEGEATAANTFEEMAARAASATMTAASEIAGASAARLKGNIIEGVRGGGAEL